MSCERTLELFYLYRKLVMVCSRANLCNNWCIFRLSSPTKTPLGFVLYTYWTDAGEFTIGIETDWDKFETITIPSEISEVSKWRWIKVCSNPTREIVCWLMAVRTASVFGGWMVRSTKYKGRQIKDKIIDDWVRNLFYTINLKKNKIKSVEIHPEC